MGIVQILLSVLVLSKLAHPESVEIDEGEQYFGTPLGALHFSSDGTSAEIYAADEFTIIFNHFYHNPREGCTAMMVGPPRSEDRENVIDGHGLLIAPAHPPVAAAARHRIRRQLAGGPLSSRLEQFRSWPVEFDHLLMEPPSNNKSPSAAVQSDNSQPVGKSDINKSMNDSSKQMESTMSDGWKSQVSSSDKTSNSTNSKSIITTSTTTQVPSTETHASTSSGSTKAVEQPTTAKPIILTKSISKQNTAKAAAAPANSKTDERSSLGIVITSSGDTYTINQENMKQLESSRQAFGQARMLDAEFVRRSPSRSEFEEQSNSKWNHYDDHKGSLSSSSSVPPTTTPLFWVIKDPRESRRQRLLELRKRIGEPGSTTPTTTTTLTTAAPIDERFILPRIRDKLATFSLTNGAKINSYKWIGIYDQCLKRHVELVTLRDIDPPREEKIMPLSGWSHNITSYRVHILNCNTILIPGFNYNGWNSTRNSYFFVGVGEFPDNIEHQVIATVVGTKRNEPLRDYSGEDVLLRLPKGYRTFDIDFISVFNTDEQKSFAHVIIPSLLVPPCAED
ncbi:electron transfer DM13 domain-containing protein [Ditylenchus destructor]|uniref:Electron transfer DM13 domain-containing protein n=1 Tax=Ditylenchus destructor TaxID=166010 RepID=A0AAD4RBZ9_9BILA|nr:electron transfer DM13 domain-containing protein [Ditylenchus destructor]